MDYDRQIAEARTIADLFEIVKGMVWKYVCAERAGIMVGLTDLGMHNHGFIGALYSLNANTILINRQPLKRVRQAMPDLYNYYLFHLLLHEYVHAIGLIDESITRQLVAEISNHHFGSTHPVTEFSTSMSKFVPQLTYAFPSYLPPEDLGIHFVQGIDRKNTDYIG